MASACCWVSKADGLALGKGVLQLGVKRQLRPIHGLRVYW